MIVIFMKLSKAVLLRDFLSAIMRLLVNADFAREFSRWSKVYKAGARINYSFSQSFEDLLLLKILPSTGTYLDVGAHHPLHYSNTYQLHLRGWRGTNIDANPNLLAKFNEFRPHDNNICAAIGSKSAYNLSIFDEPLVSSVNKDFIELAENAGYRRMSTVEIEGLTLRYILEEYFEDGCDLLLLDIEGSELDALTSGGFLELDLELRPKWVLLEEDRSLEEISISEETSYLTSSGYTLRYILPTAVLFQLTN